MDNNINVNGNNVPNVDYQNNMNGKKNNGLVVLLVFLLIAAVGFGAFQFGMMYSNKENKIEETKEGNTESEKENKEEKIEEKEPVKNSNYTFYKERKENITQGNTSFNVVSYYYLDSVELVTGTVKYLRREIFINGNKITDSQLMYVGEANDDFDKVTNEDTLNDYKTFVDAGNNEAILVYNLGDCTDCMVGNEYYSPKGYETYAYVLNKTGNVYKKILFKDEWCSNHGVLVNQSDIGDRNYKENSVVDPNVLPEGAGPYILYSDGILDVHDSFMYYLDYTGETVKEYKLSVKNNVLNDEFVKTYTGDNVLQAGGC